MAQLGDDDLFPVYCIDCKVQVPRAVSNTNRGRCDDCHAKAVQKAQDDAKYAADMQLQKAQKVAAYRLSLQGYSPSGLRCQFCDYQNIFRRERKQQYGGVRAFGMFMGFLGFIALCVFPLFSCFTIPLLLLMLIQDRRMNDQYYCPQCNREWQ